MGRSGSKFAGKRQNQIFSRMVRLADGGTRTRAVSPLSSLAAD